MTSIDWRGVLVAGVALWITGAGGARAQEPMHPAEPAADSALADPRAAALDARAAEIAAQLRCPVCSGQSVLESNAAISQEMQEVIRERLERGESDEEILAYFRGSYGDWIILRPRATGFTLLVYLLPALGLVGGAAWLFLVIRRWTSGTEAAASYEARGEASGEMSAEDEAWLRETIGES